MLPSAMHLRGVVQVTRERLSSPFGNASLFQARPELFVTTATAGLFAEDTPTPMQ
jgi:hypothetical protein